MFVSPGADFLGALPR